MIGCCFLIEISRQSISLLYGREGERHDMKPIEERQKKYALSIGQQNGKGIVDFIKSKLTDFLKTYDVTLEQVKASLPVGVLFTDDVDESVRDFVPETLVISGFSKLKVIDLNALLAHSVLNYPLMLVLTSDGEDLYCRLYNAKDNDTVAFETFPKVGRDPRVEKLAEDIWEQVSGRASYLEKKACMPVIRDEVKDFLASGLRGKEGEISLEKETFGYYIDKNTAFIPVNGCGSNDISRLLTEFIQSNHISKSDCTLILGKGLCGNSYFKEMLGGMFTTTSELNEAWEETLRQMVCEDLMSCTPSSGSAVPIADAVPQKNIQFTLGETSIAFNIAFPEKAFAIQIKRDGEDLRTITSPQFTDTDLEPDHAYTYSFVTVFKDETGRKFESRELSLTLTTSPIDLPSPISLQVAEQANKVTLTWEKPERGEIKVYWDTKPFDVHCNDTIDIDQFDHTLLSTLDNTCIVEKNFSGERFYLPVVVIRGQGVAGEQQVIKSMMPPTGVRAEDGQAGEIKVVWLWDVVDAVRVSWYANGENVGWKDIERTQEGKSEFSFMPPAKVSNVEIVVQGVHKAYDGSLQESVPVKINFSLKEITVTFVKAKSDATLFGNKNKYSITVKTDSPLPCDLYLIIEEGKVPINLENFTSLLTVSKDDLKVGEEKKYQFEYKRIDKREKLYLRLIVTDLNFRRRVMIKPDTQTI